MKRQKLIGILVLIISIKATAQTFTFKSKIDSIFMNVNKSSISTGLLKQTGYPIYDLLKLTGQSNDTAIIPHSLASCE